NVIHYIFTSAVFFRTALLIGGLLCFAVYLTFTEYSYFSFLVVIILLILLLKFQFKIFPVSTVIEKAYDRFFFNGRYLKDLKHSPLLAIGSSNLHTGKPFTFSRNKMGDSDYAYMTLP